MFNLVTVGESPSLVLDDAGIPLTFDTGALAAAACAEHLATKGMKVRPQRAIDDTWKARELARFASGQYTRLPWSELSWYGDALRSRPALHDHFAHLSIENDAMIAYTADADKGIADRQTRVKPGRYLAAFFSDFLSANEIRDIATAFDDQYGDKLALQFAETADDIEDVYTRGPSSCMSHVAGDYDSDCHPVRVYAAGDLQVAYIERNEEVTARAIVWPAKMVHSRIYGDETRLSSLLSSAGYTAGSLAGARLRAVECNDGYVVPYVDGHSYADLRDDVLIIGRNGDISLSETNGISEGSRYSCCNCSARLSDDDIYSTDAGEIYCEGCYSEVIIYCDYFEESVMRSDGDATVIITESGRTEYWCERAIERHAFTCDRDGNIYADGLAVEMADGDTWSIVAFTEHGFTCDGNGGNYPNDETVQMANGEQWSQEHFDTHGTEIDGENYPNDALPKIDAAPIAPRDWKASTIARPYHTDDPNQMALPIGCKLQFPDVYRIAPDTGDLSPQEAFRYVAASDYYRVRA